MTMLWPMITRAFFKELVEHHVSGQLKVAPEHISGKVLEKNGQTLW